MQTSKAYKGIILPAIPKFPGEGYTLMMWIRLETVSDPSGADSNYTPYLASFQTDDL